MSVLERCLASVATSLLVVAASSSTASAAAVCSIPGFDQAAFGDVSVSMSNGSTDSYDSTAAGTYATTKCPIGAPTNGSTCVGGIATNGTANGALDLGPGADVNGGCTIGSGGSTSAIACQASQEPTCSASGPCNGSAVLSAPVALPSVTVPTWPAGTTPGSLAASITPNKSYTSMSFGGSASNILTFNGTGDYVLNGLTLSGNASLALAAGTSAVIYMTANFDIGGNGITNPGGKATDLIIMCSDAVTDAKINGNGSGAFGLYCPKADVKITGNGEVFGAVVGKTVSFSGSNGIIHYDKALASSTSGAITCAQNEVSRAQPIIGQTVCAAGQCGTAAAATYSSIFQGTFEQTTTAITKLTTVASVATFEFPWIKGHMRARDLASVTTTGSTYSSGTVLFDAGATGKIPAATLAGCSTYTGTCRQVFTNTNTTPASGATRFPTITSLNTSDATADLVGPLIASTADVPAITRANWKTIITTILNGKLGGVDRSTVAVIEASALANASTRPKMVYFGGTDGMLHAACAEVGGTTPTGSNICPAMGTELWAFLPRAQLGLIKNNAARIDGSVHVVDAFADFSNPQTGKKAWRTILTFQTGYTKSGVTNAFPAAYAVDVTDPANPKVLWEYTTPTTPGTSDFGTGTDVAVGPSLINSARFELAVLETNNGGSGGSGVTTVAVDLALGARKWIFGSVYPAADLVPATGLPGGAVGIDLNETGYYSDYMFADLYGRVWRVNASTGVSVTGATTPLFKFSSNFKPIGGSPALWRITAGGALYAAFASGGYMDQENTAWMSGNQYIVVAKVKPAGTPPLTEASPALTGDVRIAEVLSSGYGSFSSPTIVGDQLFITADAGNINATTYGAGVTNTGKVFSVDLNGVTATSSIVVAGGASSLAQGGTGTTLYASGNGKQTQLATAATSVTGQSVDSTAFSKTSRNLWLRTE